MHYPSCDHIGMYYSMMCEPSCVSTLILCITPLVITWVFTFYYYPLSLYSCSVIECLEASVLRQLEKDSVTIKLEVSPRLLEWTTLIIVITSVSLIL